MCDGRTWSGQSHGPRTPSSSHVGGRDPSRRAVTCRLSGCVLQQAAGWQAELALEALLQDTGLPHTVPRPALPCSFQMPVRPHSSQFSSPQRLLFAFLQHPQVIPHPHLVLVSFPDTQPRLSLPPPLFAVASHLFPLVLFLPSNCAFLTSVTCSHISVCGCEFALNIPHWSDWCKSQVRLPTNADPGAVVLAQGLGALAPS